MTALSEKTDSGSLAELLRPIGQIALSRIRRWPAPGTAKVADVLTIHRRECRLYELVDGVLVEKAMAYRESCLVLWIAQLLREWVVPRNLGLVSGESGMMQIFTGLVRIPDVAFVSWDRVPGRKMPASPIPKMVPDLAVEVISESNSASEMKRKLSDNFKSGVRLVWLVNPQKRRVAVYTAPTRPTYLLEPETLTGVPVLPGFKVELSKLFAELDCVG